MKEDISEEVTPQREASGRLVYSLSKILVYLPAADSIVAYIHFMYKAR